MKDVLETEQSSKKHINSRNIMMTQINNTIMNQLNNLNLLNSSVRATSKIKSLNYDNNSTISSRNHLNNTQENYQMKPFEEHSQELRQLMNRYRIDTSSDLNPSMNNSDTLKEDSARLSSSMIKIHVEKTDYKNLREAKEQMLSNKQIHDEVSAKNYLRQKKIFMDKIQNISGVLPNMYVKITNTYPKNKEFLTNPGQPEINRVNNISLNVFSNGIADMYGYYIYCNKSFPESREQFSICGDFFNTFIFGGYSSKLFNDLWEFDAARLSFNKLSNDSVGPNPRFGHSSTIFNRKIYFYGGKIKTNNFSYLADLDIYCLDEKQWTNPFVSTKNYFKQRKNHIAELIGNQIFFHGGFDEDNQVLSDCIVLNLLPNLKFSKINISNKITPPGLAGHSCCFVIGNEIKSSPKLNIYSFPSERGFKSKGRRIKEKGLYIFGGKNEKGNLSNDLWIVRVGHKPIEWIKAETVGKKPSGRYLHSMNYYEEGNYLIVYGGKNDIDSISIFNDIYLFELSRFEWIEIKVFSDSPINVYRRCGHIGIISGHKLIIFGGMNNENYIGSSLFIICLDYCYNYSNDNKIINDDEKFKKLYMSELSDNKKKHKNSQKKQFFQNSNYYLPPIK